MQPFKCDFSYSFAVIDMFSTNTARRVVAMLQLSFSLWFVVLQLLQNKTSSYHGKVGRASSEECVLALLQAKCLPILLYGTEACPLLSIDRRSFEFTVNRLFMKIVRTGSPAVVRECQQNFNFLPIESQLEIRTAKFLQAFSVTENTLCLLFKQHACSHAAWWYIWQIQT